MKSSIQRARWICNAIGGGPKSAVAVPYFRREFVLEGAVESARLDVTALGLYEIEINGRRGWLVALQECGRIGFAFQRKRRSPDSI